MPVSTSVCCVGSFEAIAHTQFAAGVNALCWRRELQGDFAELVERLNGICGEGITALEQDELESLALSAAGGLALKTMLEDARRLRELGLQPELNFINGCYLDATPGPVRTDVCSWHVDSATVPADTWLCTYFGATTEALCDGDAIRRVDVPETRAELLRMFGGAEGEAFEAFLSENCYDLHYQPLRNATPIVFGLGHLWRVATLCPGSTVPPCIHRAPESPPGQPRLLLIA